MEAVTSIYSNAENKQSNSFVIKQTNKEVCKNRIEMPFKELIAHLYGLFLMTTTSGI